MFITCQLIDLLLIVEQKLQAIKCALPLGNERSPGVTCDHVKGAGKFGGQVLWCPQKGHKLQQNGYNRLGTPTEQNMGSGYELLATRCKVEGG